MSFLERTKTNIKEAFSRAESYEETLAALGEALLKSADRENRLEYLKRLASRQKDAARRFKRSDPVTSLLNKSDYYRTMADIVALEKEIEEIDLTVAELNDGVKDCYLSPVDLEVPPDFDEAVAQAKAEDEGAAEKPAEEDVFANSGDPVDLSITQPFVKAEKPADDTPDNPS